MLTRIKSFKRSTCILLSLLMLCTVMLSTMPSSTFADTGGVTTVSTNQPASAFGSLLETSNRFIVIKHKQLGGSHYAYTEGVSDEVNGVMGNELNFDPGSQMVLLTLNEVDGIVERKEEILLESTSGVLRDPDVSEDGLKVLFSWKQERRDDFHIYEMDIATKEYRQLTFGLGIADIEPKYLPGGRIIFSSTRCIQYVDCWITPVSNMYTCNADGTNIKRLGYDQVHTTYPTVTSDGRVLYTRWDYNDRSQMFIQGVFQMFPDGTNQTEVFGNNSSFPTALLHTREVPGKPGVYASIASGHHTYQAGKLVLVDTSEGRNDREAVSFVFPDSKTSTKNEEDAQNQDGPIYKYPIALNESEFLVSYIKSGWNNNNKRGTRFGIYYMNSETGQQILISSPTNNYGASQVAIIKTRSLYERPSMVNHSSETGTFYMANVYEGEGMKGVEFGTAKYLRVIGLEFRTSSIGATIGNGTGSSDQFSPIATGNGAWDIKHVLGIVNIEEDGSALFKVPANIPIYFQVLNADGELIQSMRSWSTLMPNEVFSCIGCHEDKNTAPPSVNAKFTDAMSKGVQTLKADLWMTKEDKNTYNPLTDSKGFSYLENVQPILDDNCIQCHNNTVKAINDVGTSLPEEDESERKTESLFRIKSSDWKYIEDKPSDDWYKSDFNDSSWETGRAPFGNGQRTDWTSSNIYIRNTFTVDNLDSLKNKDIILRILYDENPEVYLNGELIFSASDYVSDYIDRYVTDKFMEHVKSGENVVAVSAINTAHGQVIDIGFYATDKNTSDEADNPISFKSTKILGEREKTFYNLSYLVLTGSKSRGNQFQGSSVNNFTNWISSMSQSEILEPYQFGSTKSPIIEKIKSGHGKLSKEEIQTIAAWIDLGVPFKGSYDEAHNWSPNDFREYSEKVNKHAYYDTADKVTKQISTGKVSTDSLEFTLTYKDKNDNEVGSTTSSGLLTLDLDSKLVTGGKVIVNLPEGIHYFFLNINPRLPEALIYSPSSTYEYIIPSYARDIFPSAVLSINQPVITARIASEKDLTTNRNLALNPYDLKDSSESFPHASASNVYNNDNSPEFSARNAIDGFKINNGHGKYPVQSWGPDIDPENLTWQVDFGTEVYVNSVAITLRADFPHDTIFTKALLEFSDGSTQEVILNKTADTQTFDLNGIKKTSFVKIKDFEKDDGDWASLTEVEVFGTVKEVFKPSLEKISITGEGVTWDKTLDPDVYEYLVITDKKSGSITIKDFEVKNTSSISLRINDNDVPFDPESGFSLNGADTNIVQLILSGPGGSVAYTFEIGPKSSGLGLILGIAGGIVVIGLAAAYISLKIKKPGIKKT